MEWNSLSEKLTETQQQIVSHHEGPLLVIAGPGSGKTRVVTNRIATMLQNGVPGYSILAITFTNKASREMKSRLDVMAPQSRVFVSTFHRLCSWMLRRNPEAVGLREGFSIFDTKDQVSLAKRCLEELNIDKKLFNPSRLLGRISHQKNELITPEIYKQHYRDDQATHFDSVVAKLYPKYQQALLEANAVDFDDLLMHAVTLLEENEELKHTYTNRFRFLLVDEYQDTNYAQYSLVRALGTAHQNVCATGDPDQLIYSWRGSRLENIMHFTKDFPETRVYRLEENFRSTKAILRPADKLIAHNQHRKHKELYTNNDEGKAVEVQLYKDQHHEADEIALAIKRTIEKGDRKWSDFAILFRVNSLSRALELALHKHGIPYQMAGGVEYWQRTEIKDVTSYLRAIVNPADNEAVLRIINTPTRGIGDKSKQKLSGWAQRYGGSILEACRHVKELPGFAKRTANAIEKFVLMLDGLAQESTPGVATLLQKLLERTKITINLEKGDKEGDLQRKANIDELINAASEYEITHKDDASITGFLEETVLVNDQDRLDEKLGKVSLMTLHSAKGLEFPVVYIVGVEEQILPHERALKSTNQLDLEEERRLLFVGITRAREELYLTETKMRMNQGRVAYSIPSSFQREMQPEIKNVEMPVTRSIEWTYGNEQATNFAELYDELGLQDFAKEKPAEEI